MRLPGLRLPVPLGFQGLETRNVIYLKAAEAYHPRCFVHRQQPQVVQACGSAPKRSADVISAAQASTITTCNDVDICTKRTATLQIQLHLCPAGA